MSQRLHMSDDVELYSRTNDVAIRDATYLLEEYSSKFQWKKNARVIDIGSGDGTVTKILSTYLPSDYEVLVGADMKEKSVQYADANHKDDKIKFVTINIEGEILDDMKDSFDHLFSFYTFHWVKEQEKAFTNVYDLLSANGECLVMFLGYCQVYSVFYPLYKSEKWGKLLKDFDKFPSPYWYFRDPDAAITKMLKKIGYRRVDVRCKQMTHTYNDIEHMKRLISAISPFDIPKDLFPEFLDDFIEVFRTMKLIDEESGTITIIYNLLVVHCTNLRMNDNPELFNKTNYMTRKDAVNSLNDFVRKFKCKRNPRVVDIGSADGSVTAILSHYLPKHYDVLVGCDINTNSVKYANRRYGTDRIKFIQLDIEAELPNNLKEDFDQVFSFCTLHWLADPEKGYRNIYNLLKDGGECFLTVMAKIPIYDIFRALSRTVKWAPWTNNIQSFVPPYHDYQDPDDIIRDGLMTIGFNYVDTKCKQKVYVYKSIEVLKESMSSVNPFKIPEHLQEEFMEDFVEVTREMRLVAEDDSVKISYNIILIHCVKQERGQ